MNLIFGQFHNLNFAMLIDLNIRKQVNILAMQVFCILLVRACWEIANTYALTMQVSFEDPRTQAVNIKFEIDQEISSSNLIFQT